MKKLFALLLVTLLLFGLFGCGGKDEERIPVISEVTGDREETDDPSLENPTPKPEQTGDWRMMKAVRYYSDYDEERTIDEFNYDVNGNLIYEKYTNIDSDGSVGELHEYQYEYDGNGNLISEKRIDDGDSIDYWYEYEYDANGNRIRKTERYEMGGTSDYRYDYEYDANGSLIKETTFLHDTVYGWAEYQCDANGNPIRITYYDADGSYRASNEYEYDENGNLIKETSSFYNGTHYGTEYEYDAYGNQIKETSYDFDGSVRSWKKEREYEYDGNGNVIRETRYDSDGGVSDRYGYEYDENGNRIRESEFNSSGDVSEWTEYEWQYFENAKKQKK